MCGNDKHAEFFVSLSLSQKKLCSLIARCPRNLSDLVPFIFSLIWLVRGMLSRSSIWLNPSRRVGTLFTRI